MWSRHKQHGRRLQRHWPDGTHTSHRCKIWSRPPSSSFDRWDESMSGEEERKSSKVTFSLDRCAGVHAGKYRSVLRFLQGGTSCSWPSWPSLDRLWPFSGCPASEAVQWIWSSYPSCQSCGDNWVSGGSGRARCKQPQRSLKLSEMGLTHLNTETIIKSWKL